MAQLSRPYQIGLVVVLLFGAVFAFALHGRTSTTSSSSAPVAAPVPSPAPASASAPASGGSAGSAAEQAELSHHVYHGSAPGVGGLSRAIAKAHGAAAISEQNNAQLAQKSARASSASGSSPAEAPATHASATTTVVTKTPRATITKTSTVHAAVTPSQAPATPASPAAKTASGPARQLAVESELKAGKIVVLLFWNPKGTDDRVVHHELKLMLALHHNATTASLEALRHAGKFFGRNFDKSVAVHETLGASVAGYGSITRGVQVYGTPTLLIINGKGQTITLTGVTDAYGIEQAISEAHGG
jgi:hypothetical protein